MAYAAMACTCARGAGTCVHGRGAGVAGTSPLHLMAEQQQATSNDGQAAETNWHDYADSFASAPLLGHAFRMFAESPDFCGLGYCLEAGGSILILPDGTGRLVISSTRSQTANDGGCAVRHATMPLRLKGANYEAQRQVEIELAEFVEQCTIYGEAGPSSASEARTIVNDFACDILDGDPGWRHAKLGHS